MYYGASAGTQVHQFKTDDKFVIGGKPFKFDRGFPGFTQPVTPHKRKFRWLATHKKIPAVHMSYTLWNKLSTNAKQLQWRGFWINNPDKRKYFSTQASNQLDYTRPRPPLTPLFPQWDKSTFIDIMPEVTVTDEGEIIRIPEGNDFEIAPPPLSASEKVRDFIDDNGVWLAVGALVIGGVWWFNR